MGGRALIPLLVASFRASSNALSMPAARVIDSHLHVWATAEEASSKFPYAGPDQTPPPQLQDVASPKALLEKMDEAGVDGALVVQPINHKFDHSYVANAMKQHPTKFKGMLLHDPSLSPEMAVERLEELVLAGFVGVRFNPYLWPQGALMSADSGCGLAVYKRCAELKVPVGVMCFKGLELHIEDIGSLISKSPDTVLVLDHLGFCALNDEGDAAFEKLLSLAQHPNVCVKVSALFRNTGGVDKYPYEGVRRKRFEPLYKAFGAERLTVGTDFPFVTETEGGYQGAMNVVKSWIPEGSDRDAIMGGTAERLFGKWAS
ncbi:hypothetical protein ACHAWF_008696 [Thalassiosira exigua]